MSSHQILIKISHPHITPSLAENEFIMVIGGWEKYRSESMGRSVKFGSFFKIKIIESDLRSIPER